VNRLARGALALLQNAEVRTEVDVVGRTSHDESGHGFDAGGFGLGDASFGITEMDDLDIEAAGVQRGGDILFSSNADRAACVIEGSFGFHVCLFLGSCTTACRA
jgi:hypothetical protein